MAEDFFEAPNMLLSSPETQSTSVVRLPPIDAHTSPSSPIDLRSVEEGTCVRRSALGRPGQLHGPVPWGALRCAAASGTNGCRRSGQRWAAAVKDTAARLAQEAQATNQQVTLATRDTVPRGLSSVPCGSHAERGTAPAGKPVGIVLGTRRCRACAALCVACGPAEDSKQLLVPTICGANRHANEVMMMTAADA